MQLDGLVLFMTLAVALHAVRNKNTKLLFAGFVLGYLTETLSLRLGGTHCHASQRAAELQRLLVRQQRVLLRAMVHNSAACQPLSTLIICMYILVYEFSVPSQA